ncbi:hypothetical protein AB0M38_16080 [Streptomyces sp. NPDC051742]|uniref:hypothetical protein n=1 Tax=unclassified Streptomyces TaxID=2593676 RepID=UPI00342F488F
MVLAEARTFLERGAEVASACQVVLASDFNYTVEPGSSWSAYEQAVFSAIGATCRDGRLLEPLARLLRETDQAFRRGATRYSARRRKPVSAFIAATLHGPISPADDARLPAALITHAAHLAWPRSGRSLHQPLASSALQPWLDSLRSDDVGLMVLLCSVLRNPADAETAALAPALFARAWASDAPHLQFAGLDLLTSIRSSADEAAILQVSELLTTLHTDDVFVSTMLVDALHVYDQITSPYALDDIAEEISLLLIDPNQSDPHARARRIMESQFEEVIAAPFIQALDTLEPAARQALTILALSEGDAGMFTDVLLRELLQAGDPAALPALQYWASRLDVRDPFPQGAISCHLLGIEGCAAHLPTPPHLLKHHHGADAEAWRCYGQILFWIHRPDLSADDQRAQCLPLWEQLTGPLLGAAVDPLHQYQYVAQFARDIGTTALGRILDTFPAQARSILHHALSAPDHLSSLFPYPRPQERTTTALRLLGRVGDRSSLDLLASYRGNPTFASVAAEVIRAINNRSVGRARF